MPADADRVLLVDDDPVNLQVLSRALEDLGVTLLAANDGESALGIAREARPALVLLDINMPGMGGFEACRRLKADPLTADAIIVFLSASGGVEDKLRGFDAGAADYVVKPFSVEEVTARVRTHLEHHRRHRALTHRAGRPEGGVANDLGALLRAGESDRFELKSTMRMNLQAGKPGKEIENAWLKTVVAFLNTEGGVLVVGVADDGSVLGIEPDAFPNPDRYLLHANNLIRNSIGAELAPFIDIGLEPLDGKQVMVVRCRPSPQPAFLRRDADDEFFIRMGPGTRRLLTRETLSYIRGREESAQRATLEPLPAEDARAGTGGDGAPILIVDDNTQNLRVLHRTLEKRAHRVLVARSGEQALEIASEASPALVLLDVMMPPGIDGFETCRRLKAGTTTRDIPVIFMSALSDTSDKVRGLEAGAVDYISKPFQPDEVLARVDTQVRLRRLRDELARANAMLAGLNGELERKVEERSAQLMRSRDAVIFGLAKLAESRDNDTGEHLERICRYVEILATEVARDDPGRDSGWVRTMATTAALHDIGKVGIPDAVLLKPGRLTDEERDVIQRHTTIGGDTLMALRRRWGEDAFLVTATEIAFSHHERWDGDGYPFGLAGDSIPLAGRVCAVADVYDALRSERPYKPAMTHEAAHAEIVAGAGTRFDPGVVDAFVRVSEEFRAASIALSDSGDTP